jgi:beta-mannosidase
VTTPSAKRISELNSGWEFAASTWLDAQHKPAKLGYCNLEWLSAQVPGHVHLDLIRHGVIADPFGARAELGCQWVDEASWIFRKTFAFNADAERPRRVLRFEGLDTVCRVFLNGSEVAAHDNMFVPLEVDVSELLKAGDNELRVEFDSAPRVGRERRARYLAKEGLADDVARFDERAFLRKAQYMFAWDWGPRLVSAGLWKGVSLSEHAARILDVHVTQKHLEGGRVELAIQSRFEGDGQVVHLIEGVAAPLADGQRVLLERPELWWPAGLGAQKLYEVKSFLVPSGVSRREELEARAFDQHSQRIGLRRLRLLRERDAQGESFEFEVNGLRLWAVGANWIPDHSFPSRVDRARIEAQARRALDMNMNMLRVWGGGVYESDEFYAVCDELGLLVWQDFPFACSYVPDDEPEQAVLRVEARANIERLRNHACLAIWCGNNENLTMWQSKWGRPLPQPSRYYGEKLYDGTLPELLAALDPERPYVASSPIGGLNNANDGDIGDQHYWDVWHGRGDWKFYKDSTGRFASEFGFASAPGHSVWQKIFPGDAEWSRRDVRDGVARWHDKTSKGYETYVGYVELHYPAARDLEEFTYYSQLNQRDALRFGIEHFRRTVGCRGALIWQLNDCWPVQSWAVLDSDGAYKAAAFELRRLYAPAHQSLEFEVGGDVARLWTLLDNAHAPVRGEAVLEARRLSDGAVLERWSKYVELCPGERGVSIEARVGQLSSHDTLLSASFLGTHTFRLLSEPKQARLELPRLRLSRTAEGVLVETDRPVVDLFVWSPEGELELLDNFVTLPGPGRVLLRARGSARRLLARSLAGRHLAVE